tara:strand:+ start:1773 stop:2018 length:246 start_codon:yes stop_codon:yes gene_type:complete
MSKTDEIVNEIEQMKDRYEKLSEMMDKVIPLIENIRDIEDNIVDGVEGSNVAEADYCSTLKDIYKEMEKIEEIMELAKEKI